MTTDDKLNAMQAVTAVLAGIFIGVALTDTTTSEFWLYRYQTLVAGILAIIAAGWTVFEMRRTDGRQDQRHIELVKLNVRADRLKASRAAYIFPKTFRRFADELAGMMPTIASWNDQDSLQDIFRSKPNFEEFLEDVESTLLMKPITDAQDIFDDRASATYQVLIALMENIDIAGRMNAIRTMGRTQERKFEVDEIKARLMRLASELRAFAIDLERQRDSFQ
ncbi:hypothetical protein NKH84_22345 [Mesorhizobium sp. M0902]|uniref:hypothetical protein n=1 Tax=Mesorhizobium sp. M0902 TaxID=2957021 RepID=UPI003336553E